MGRRSAVHVRGAHRVHCLPSKRAAERLMMRPAKNTLGVRLPGLPAPTFTNA